MSYNFRILQRLMLLLLACFVGPLIIMLFFTTLQSVQLVQQHCIPFSYVKPLPPPQRCTFPTCFDYTKCHSKRIRTYFYPRILLDKGNEMTTQSLLHDSFIATLKNLSWLEPTDDAGNACLLIPHIADFRCDVRHPCNGQTLSRHLPFWNGGRNHLIFDTSSSSSSATAAVGRAILWTVQSLRAVVRPAYDIGIILPHTAMQTAHAAHPHARQIFLSFRGVSVSPEFSLAELESLSNVVIAIQCLSTSSFRCTRTQSQQLYEATDDDALLDDTIFALVLDGYAEPLHHRLSRVLSAGAIPVIIHDDFVPPFRDIIQWNTFSIHCPSKDISQLGALLHRFSSMKIHQMQQRVKQIYAEYFSDLNVAFENGMEIVKKHLYTLQ